MPKKSFSPEIKILALQYLEEGRYIVIQELAEKEHFSIVLLCEIAGVSRAAYLEHANSQQKNRIKHDIRTSLNLSMGMGKKHI